MRDLLNKVASKVLDKWERIGLSLDIELDHARATRAGPPFAWATIVDTLKDPISRKGEFSSRD